ncbi:hypothetical protein ERO13_A02G054700v2 [Gossypium hirsutum]|uniref:E3 ubiquitin-protein ligase RNF12-A n=1 Tax=Gossypium hirsutum TaxID=3635 RepID=A0A1U8MKL1_GOSHI|nr:E3 ubiquitin-protein ligase RNF12-A-like [Gossypium hirsutum]KAG4210524.1 hypothetical protein ERO13_A02G054700v2 [Gossypium hirsutum]
MAEELNSFSQMYLDMNMEVPQLKPFSSSSSSSSAVFEIEVKATFIIVDELFEEAGRILSQVTHEFPFDDLINDGNGAVLDMLNSMRVPVQQSMVEEIATTAVRLAAAARDADGKVLRMEVEIEAVVNEVPDFGSDAMDIEDDDDNEGVAMEVVAESVRKTVVETAEKDCTICLEELAVGGEAARIPCSHVFHEACIVTWLKKKKCCPCCRFDFSNLKSEV